MRRLATTIVTAPAALLVAALAVPASAGTGVVQDGLGEDLPANADISSLRARNGEGAVTVTVRFTELDPERRARVKVLVDPAPKDTTQYIVESVKRPGRAPETRLLLAPGMEFDGTPIPCDGVRGTWDSDRALVKARVPQSCMPEQGRVAKLKATTLYVERGDWTDFLRVRKGSATDV